MRCSFCGDPAAHPATGCQYSETCLACYACTVAWVAWVVRHTNGKGLRSGLPFYAHVGPPHGRDPM